jgi:hypothetical protein
MQERPDHASNRAAAHPARRQRQYTTDQLNQAADAAQASADAGVFANFTIGTIEPITPEFDGITITGQHKSNPADTYAADAALSQQATQALGVAVKVTTAAAPVPPAATKRNDDSSPFNAGGMLQFSFMQGGVVKNGYCSTGFALLIGGTPYTTLARHCTSPYAGRYDCTTSDCQAYAYRSIDSTSAILKTYNRKQQSTDGGAMLLTAGGSRSMFYGGLTSSLKARVVADPNTGSGANIVVGDYVCTSGANSGTHCSGGAIQRVQATGTRDVKDNWGIVSTIRAQRVDGGLAAVSGDSGGPVYRNNTSTDVYAVGMIQGGDDQKYPAPCGATRVSPGGHCSSMVYYTSINTIIRGVPGSSLYHY